MLYYYVNRDEQGKEGENLLVPSGIETIETDFTTLESLIIATEHSEATDHNEQINKKCQGWYHGTI